MISQDPFIDNAVLSAKHIVGQTMTVCQPRNQSLGSCLGMCLRTRIDSIRNRLHVSRDTPASWIARERGVASASSMEQQFASNLDPSALSFARDSAERQQQREKRRARSLAHHLPPGVPGLWTLEQLDQWDVPEKSRGPTRIRIRSQPESPTVNNDGNIVSRKMGLMVRSARSLEGDQSIEDDLETGNSHECKEEDIDREEYDSQDGSTDTLQNCTL